MSGSLPMSGSNNSCNDHWFMASRLKCVYSVPVQSSSNSPATPRQV